MLQTSTGGFVGELRPVATLGQPWEPSDGGSSLRRVAARHGRWGTRALSQQALGGLLSQVSRETLGTHTLP